MGFVYCKDYTNKKFCLTENLIKLFFLGDFISFEAKYSTKNDTYLIINAYVNYVTLRYEIGILKMPDFEQNNKKQLTFVVCLY